MRVMTERRSSLPGPRTLYEKRREQRTAPAGRSFFLARFPRRSGNADVGPVVLARESRKETGGGNTARRAPADICKIGEIALQLFLIILPQRKPPYAVPRLRPGCFQLVCEDILVREQPGADVAQGDDAGSRKRSDVYDGLGLEALGVAQRIGKNEASFCIGIENLDGLARHDRADITRFGGGSFGHVLAGGDQPDY